MNPRISDDAISEAAADVYRYSEEAFERLCVEDPGGASVLRMLRQIGQLMAERGELDDGKVA